MSNLQKSFTVEQAKDQVKLFFGLGRRTVEESFKLGEMLVFFRQEKKRGTWFPFLEEIGINQRIAERLMTAYNKKDRFIEGMTFSELCENKTDRTSVIDSEEDEDEEDTEEDNTEEEEVEEEEDDDIEIDYTEHKDPVKNKRQTKEEKIIEVEAFISETSSILLDIRERLEVIRSFRDELGPKIVVPWLEKEMLQACILSVNEIITELLTKEKVKPTEKRKIHQHALQQNN